jgi:hypothetical protein
MLPERVEKRIVAAIINSPGTRIGERSGEFFLDTILYLVNREGIEPSTY